MTARPLHPGEALANIMRDKNITLDDLIAAGLPAQWLNDLLRRLEELPLIRGTDKVVRLAHATGLPVSAWIETQRQWGAYAGRRRREMREDRRRQVR